MKLIADIGTNPELIKVDVTDVLLYHFLKHYDSIGVTEFILHGNNDVIDALKPSYTDDYNINFIPIYKEKFYEYRERDWNMFNMLKTSGQLSQFCHPEKRPNTCPLWIIQNDLKKQYIAKDELCFIVDLDEFVRLSSNEFKMIQESDIHFCRGILRDRAGFSADKLVTLDKETHISKQLNQQIDITRGVAKRAVNKVIITRGHLDHCHGHHGVYNKSDVQKKKWINILDVYHYKYFKQNIDSGLGVHGRKEQDFFKQQYD